MFQMLLSGACPKSRNFSVSCAASEEVHKKLRGSIVRTTDQSGQKDILCDRTSRPVYKMGELPGKGVITAQGQAWHQSAGGEQLYCASLVCFGIYLPLSLSFLLQLLVLVSLLLFFFTLFQLLNLFSQSTSLIFFSFLILLTMPSVGGRGSEQAAAWYLVPGWG